MVGQKLKFVLSDLHIGAGYANDGNRSEDFLAEDALVNFLHHIERESKEEQGEVELIINGNFFEFLRVPAVDHYDPAEIYPKEAYLDSSEEASTKRLNIIGQGHPAVFEALSNFMCDQAPQRRITIIKGNHDVNLFWPRVKSRLRKMLGASGSRASLLLFAEEFVSREKIYIEHGHQKTEQINRYIDFLDPRHPNDPAKLYYPLGSRFIVDFCNDAHHGYYFANNIKPITTLIWCTLQWDLNFASKILANFFRQAPVLAFNGSKPNRKKPTHRAILIEDLHDQEVCYQMLQRCARDIAFREQFYGQIQQHFCSDGQVVSHASGQASTNASSDPLMMGRAAQKQQRALLRQAAEEIARREGARVILFGHTHHATQEALECGGTYINTGCWLEDFSDAPPEIWQALFDNSQPLGQRPSHLPYARIDYDAADKPTAQLLDFAANTYQDTNDSPRLSKKLFEWASNLFNEPAAKRTIK